MIDIFQRIIWFLIAVLLLSFCKNRTAQPETPEQKQLAEVTARARRMAAASPGEALALCDTAETLARTYALTDSFDLKIAYARASAVAAMGMPDSAFSIVNRIYEQKKNWPDTAAMVRILYNMGWYSYTGGHIPAAENYISRTISLMERANIVKNRANYMTLYADILRDRGKFTEAQDCLFRAVRIAESVKDTFALGLCYKGIGHVYVGSNNMDKALEYYRKAYQSFDELNDREYSLPVLTNIALSYRKSKPDSSLYYYKLVLAADSMNSNVNNKVMTLFNMGNVFFDLGLMDEARSCYDEVFDICQKNGIVSGVPRVYCGYGALESSKGNLQKAEEYYEKALELVRESEENVVILEVMRNLLDTYEKEGEWKNYAKLSVEAKILEDTLLSGAKRMQLQDIVQSYELEKREMQTRHLRSALESENWQNRLLTILLLVFVSAIVLTLVMIKINKRLKKGIKSSHELLMEQYRQERLLRKREQKNLQAARKQSATAQLLSAYFDSKKPYLNSEIKAADIADALGIAYKELLDAVQELDYPNFKVMLNRYRIEEVILKFEDPAFDQYTIEALARDAGFGSRATFYTVFESEKGVKPAFYRSQINLPVN
jgi:tetratricopeptide (TPR) repeat protein